MHFVLSTHLWNYLLILYSTGLFAVVVLSPLKECWYCNNNDGIASTNANYLTILITIIIMLYNPLSHMLTTRLICFPVCMILLFPLLFVAVFRALWFALREQHTERESINLCLLPSGGRRILALPAGAVRGPRHVGDRQPRRLLRARSQHSSGAHKSSL